MAKSNPRIIMTLQSVNRAVTHWPPQISRLGSGVENANGAPRTLTEAMEYFSDLEIATTFLAKLRWPEGPVCPRCGGKEHSYLSTRRLWKCKACKKQFSVKVGTIFEGSPVGLDKWLAMIWMLANSTDEISSYELHHTIEVTQKTAWSMMRRIKLAMQDEASEAHGKTMKKGSRNGQDEEFTNLKELTQKLLAVSNSN